MCTAITFYADNHYFGRNLDIECSYDEHVIVTPRNFPLPFRNGILISDHPAIIGMATVSEGYPLYYDAMNEYGLSIAGLNFPGNSVYHPESPYKDNIAAFELIPWILAQAKTCTEALALLDKINIWNISFNANYPTTPLHWFMADRDRSVTIEPCAHGLKVYDNPVGVLTNNPPFSYHMQHLTDYLNLHPETPVNPYANQVTLTPYSRGQGAIGLPGDLSSASRFIRAAYTKLNSVIPSDETDCVGQFFHILTAVSQQAGCVKVGDLYEKTVYTSCCNMDTGVYYYTTYQNRQITGIHLLQTPVNDNQLIRFPLRNTQAIRFEN